jgi:DNA mismatch repair protein MutS2
VNPRTLRVLEFPAIRERLTALCASPPGREIAAALGPSPEPAEAERGQQETSEARLLAETAGGLPVHGIRDIRSALHRARIEGVLSVDELLAVRDTAAVARTLKGFVAARREEAPVLAEMCEALGVFGELEAAIGKAISPEGEILDGASSELARVRRARRIAESRLRARVEEVLRTPTMARMLQEPLVTIRGDRFTVPVRAEFRNQFPGVAHDQSSSGVTIFMEPLAVVPLGNRLRELAAAEREEVTRVLRALSGAVAGVAQELAMTLDGLAAMDVVAAKARLSLEMDAARPRLNAVGMLHLRRARHPLLSGPVVPIDVELGRGFRTLIITGPNTGGKTVTLKTMGLLTLMAQAGLHIPAAAESEVGVFSQIYADIGDEQSIEQNLSTFSSHLTAIVEILRSLRSLAQHPPKEARALVLLDEIGAGTDPTEGVALARALIEALHALGVCIAVTTHYNELKAMPYTTPGMENASVEFDEMTLRPTFRLLIGTPGRSNAFAIAERLGLDPRIVAQARSSLSRRDADLTQVLQMVEAEREALAREREEVGRARSSLTQLQAQVEDHARQLEAARRQFFERAQAELGAVLRRGRQQLDALLAAMRERPSPEAAARVRAHLRDLAQTAEAHGAQAQPPPEGAPPQDLRAGEAVLVLSLNQRGVVQVPPDSRGEVEIQAGTLKVRVPATDLRRLSTGESPDLPRSPATPSQLEKALQVFATLDLRGRAAEDAVQELDKYLDDATLAGLERVTVIHGKGTGALRQAVHAHLSRHPEVAAFRLGGETEGGSGATIVELAHQ